MVKTLIVLILLGAAAFAGLQVIPIVLLYREHLRFQDAIAIRAKSSLPLHFMDTRAFLTESIVKMLDGMGAQYLKEDIQVNVDEGRKSISAHVRYSRPHRSLFFQNPKPFYAKVEASRTSGEEGGVSVSAETPVKPLLIPIFAIALLIMIISQFWFIVEAFKVGVLWGLIVLFVPLASLVFLVIYWENAKKPFVLGIGGTGILLLSIVLVL